jgi:hypothetical protein
MDTIKIGDKVIMTQDIESMTGITLPKNAIGVVSLMFSFGEPTAWVWFEGHPPPNANNDDTWWLPVEWLKLVKSE